MCRRIRQGHQVPVLMLTALSDVEDKLEAFGAGADDYLTKPFEPGSSSRASKPLPAGMKRPLQGARGAGEPGRFLAYPGLVIDLRAGK